MTDVDWPAVEAFMQSPEYLALGVIARQNALYAAFPTVEQRELALTARHVESVVWDLNPPSTPDPDKEMT